MKDLSAGLKLVAKLRRKQLVLAKKSRSQDVGFRSSIHKGVGLEFEEFREYAPGDPVRLIDWKLFARSEKLFSRLYREDRGATIRILVDQTKSMFFTDRKLNSSLQLAFVLASLVTLNRDKAIIRIGDRRFTAESFDSLLSIFANFTAQPSEKDFLPVLREDQTSRASKLFIISDFFYSLSDLEKNLQTLSIGDFEGFAIQVLDPDELNPPFQKWRRVKDIESGDPSGGLTVSKLTVDSYMKNLRLHLQQLEAMLRRFKIKPLLYNCEKNLEDFFLKDILKAGVIK